MNELIILGTALVLVFVYEVLPRVCWVGESWKHLRLDSNYNPRASRGRVFKEID